MQPKINSGLKALREPKISNVFFVFYKRWLSNDGGHSLNWVHWKCSTAGSLYLKLDLNGHFKANRVQVIHGVKVKKALKVICIAKLSLPKSIG